MPYLLVGLGGALGSMLRFFLARTLPAWAPTAGLPGATLAANVLGSFGLGVAFHWLDGRALFGHDARHLVGTGMMGGFTTYSTFNLETLRLVEAGEGARAALYMGITVATCAVAGLAGIALGRQIS